MLLWLVYCKPEMAIFSPQGGRPAQSIVRGFAFGSFSHAGRAEHHSNPTTSMMTVFVLILANAPSAPNVRAQAGRAKRVEHG